MYTVFDKLYLARLLLNLNAKDTAAKAGTTQMTISLLERGERKNIPINYLKFLHEQGIDINWLLNEEEDIDSGYRKDKRENIREDIKRLKEQLTELTLKVDSVISNGQFR